MSFPDAMRALAGNSQFLAILPGGPIVVMTPRGHLKDIRNGKPRGYSGKFTDYVSIEWQVVTGDQLRKMAEQNA
jgi:hypothetical protein